MVDKASGEVWREKAVTPVKVAVLLVQELCTMRMAPQLALSKKLHRTGFRRL